MPKIYTTDDGLSHNHVRQVAQDKDGYLWIATWDGLNRFDGYEFKNYHHDPYDSTSIPYVEVFKVLTDSDNTVWIVSGNTLARYNRSRDEFVRYGKNAYPLQDGMIKDIILNSSGNLIVIFQSGYSTYDAKSDSFRKISFGKDQYLIKKYGLIHADFDNLDRLWIGNDSLLYPCITKPGNPLSFDIQVKGVLRYSQEKIANNNLYLHFEVFFTNDNSCYIAGNRGLYLLNKYNGLFKNIETIPDGSAFTGTKMISWCKPGKSISIYDVTIFKSFTFSFPYIFELPYLDTENNIWFGGISLKDRGIGLHCLIKTPGFFRHYLREPDFIENNNVVSLFKDSRENIWVGLNKTDYLINIHKKGKVDQKRTIPSFSDQVTSHPRSYIEQPKGILWIGYYNKWLCRYNLKHSSGIIASEHILSRPWNGNPADFRVMALIDSNRIVYAGDEFVAVYHIPSGKMQKMASITGSAYSLFIDNDRTIWVGENQGKLGHYTSDLALLNEYTVKNAAYNIECIVPDDEGGLWLGMLGGGLAHFYSSSGESRYYTTSHGLSNNTVYSIQKDKKGRLWLSTNHGISCFNISTNTFRIFGINDGLRITEFNSDASFQAEDGEILMGGMGGFVGFFPDSIIKNQSAASFPLLISSISVFGKKLYFYKPLPELDQLKLDKGSNNFNIHFVSTDLTHANQIRYRYWLKGIDPDWQTADTKLREVNYVGLSPGKYIFTVECTNRMGVWKQSKTLEIFIPPYYYQTFGFKLLILISLIMTALSIFRLILRQIKTHEQKLQEQLKLEAIQGQMNPHFIYNSLNSINYFISISDKNKANQYLSDFSGLMRAVLNNSTREYIPLEKEIALIESYLRLEKLRFSEKFDYSVEVDPLLNSFDIEITPSLVQPFVENSVWHGIRRLTTRKGMIRISFQPHRHDCIICTIEDDGIGVKRSAELKSEDQRQRHSRGLELIRERLRIINYLHNKGYGFVIEPLFPDRLETGTRVTISVPVKQEKSNKNS